MPSINPIQPRRDNNHSIKSFQRVKIQTEKSETLRETDPAQISELLKLSEENSDSVGFLQRCREIQKGMIERAKESVEEFKEMLELKIEGLKETVELTRFPETIDLKPLEMKELKPPNPNEVTFYIDKPKIPNVRIGKPTNVGKINLDSAYEKASLMQRTPTTFQEQDIPSELLRPRRETDKIDKAYELMEAKYEPKTEEANQILKIREFHPVSINLKPLKARTVNIEEFIQSYDLSWHQGFERAGKYQNIKAELKELLDLLPLKPNLHQLLEVIHQRYPELQVRAVPKEEMIEKILLAGLEKNTPLYTEQKKAHKAGTSFAFFVPGNHEEVQKAAEKGMNMIAEKLPPAKAKIFKQKGEINPHELFNADPEKSMFVVNKDGSFYEAFHELIHYLQHENGLPFFNHASIPEALLPNRISANQKVMAMVMGGFGGELTHMERQLAKSEALSEAEVGQLIAQLLPGKVPEDSYAQKQHPYTMAWIGALPSLGAIRPYNPESVKTAKAIDRIWQDT